MSGQPQPHIQLTDELGVADAIVVGDPARVDVIAGFLDDVQALAYNREFKSVRGSYRGRPLLVLSTGIGAPSAGIALEEMAQIGIKRVVRVGSMGALQSDIPLGATVIAEGVVRGDGLTNAYVPEAYPAVPSFALLAAAHAAAPQAHYGLIFSNDGFYMDSIEQTKQFWSAKGVLGEDQESGALIVLGRLRGVEVLSILNNVVLYGQDLAEGVNSLVSGADAVAAGQQRSIEIALEVLSQ